MYPDTRENSTTAMLDSSASGTYDVHAVSRLVTHARSRAVSVATDSANTSLAAPSGRLYRSTAYGGGGGRVGMSDGREGE